MLQNGCRGADWCSSRESTAWWASLSENNNQQHSTSLQACPSLSLYPHLYSTEVFSLPAISSKQAPQSSPAVMSTEKSCLVPHRVFLKMSMNSLNLSAFCISACSTPKAAQTALKKSPSMPTSPLLFDRAFHLICAAYNYTFIPEPALHC